LHPLAKLIDMNDLHQATRAMCGGGDRMERPFCDATRQCDITLAHHILM